MASIRQTISSALTPFLSIAVAAVVNRHQSSDYCSSNNGKCWRTFLHAKIATCDASSPTLRVSRLDPTDSPKVSYIEEQHSSAEGSRNKPEEVANEGFRPDAIGSFYGMFPSRQLFHPAMPYPLWNVNWDGRQPEASDDPKADRQRMRAIRKSGTTRHIILIRHGQYDETHKEDDLKKLTPLGRLQADLTGKRLADMMRGADGGFDPCSIRSVRVSAMARARETAEIIASNLEDIKVAAPNPAFNEGRPCHTIPTGPVTEKIIKITDDNHQRIEGAFRDFFFRADEPTDHDTEQHEFEIVVCHANVIRYWTCRALQLPPEAWLRFCPFNCSLTYITIRPTGTVSCRMLGDIGHLPYNMQTFSGHHGFNW